MNFDKDNISDRVLKKIGQYCAQADFQPDIIGRVSSAAKSLCMWVRAMEVRTHLLIASVIVLLGVVSYATFIIPVRPKIVLDMFNGHFCAYVLIWACAVW